MLTVDRVAKAYGPTRALDGVSFSARHGEVFAVLGENGAGKSTLLRVLAGAVQPDAGSLSLDGRPLRLRSPREALRQGMVLIPQELAYVPDLTAAENIMLGAAAAPRRVVTQAQLRRAAEPFAAQLGIEACLAKRMRDLSLAEAQLVEIAKALARDARVLLLDEPTAALSRVETDRLFETMGALRARSMVLVYISHRLDEVLEHGDAVMVLRDGREALQERVRDVTKSELIAGMLGAATQGSRRPPTPSPEPRGEQLLRATDVGHAGDSGAKGITLTVRSGEILGLYGVRGAGHEAFVEALAGVRRFDRGGLEVQGRTVAPPRSVRQARRSGIAFVPADRKRHGLVLGASIVANLELPQLRAMSRWGWMSPAREATLLGDIATGMRLKHRSGSQLVRELSGGNQQKVLVGSRLATAPRVLVVHEPTRGVDIGARQEIHHLLAAMAREGTAVVMATTDIEEAVEISGRLAIVRDGRVVSMLEGEAMTQERALHDAVEGPATPNQPARSPEGVGHE